MSDAELIASAHAAWPAVWLDDAVFVAHVRSFGLAAEDQPHASDLYLACACVHGVAEAIAAIERVHFTRIREFAAAVDSSPAFVTELAQQLRAKLLVGPPPRIATYSGRGSLGGWIRVAAVRLARDIGRSERAEANRRDDLEPGTLDPELGYLKQTYGAAVSTVVQDSLAALASEDRALLKMHYVDGLTIEQVGTAFGKSRATSARMLAAARMTLVAAIRERLVGVIGVRADEADSLLAFVRSRLDLSLARALR
ncbi:MAG: sigma factor-like helix-turn-helix DNA-binding protein [Kofleriaceae bacterium]